MLHTKRPVRVAVVILAIAALAGCVLAAIPAGALALPGVTGGAAAPTGVSRTGRR